MAVVINEGTQTSIKTTDSGGQIQHVRNDGGTIGVVGAGTITRIEGGTVGNIAAGTITRVEGGTIGALAAGTITNGTVSTIGIRHPDEFATVVTTGTSDLGTIKGSVAGSAIYVTSMAISVGSATNLEIASGGTSTRIAGTFFFAANGGAMLEFNPPIRTAVGSALVFKQSAAVSPMSITATGYVD